MNRWAGSFLEKKLRLRRAYIAGGLTIPTHSTNAEDLLLPADYVREGITEEILLRDTINDYLKFFVNCGIEIREVGLDGHRHLWVFIDSPYLWHEDTGHRVECYLDNGHSPTLVVDGELVPPLVDPAEGEYYTHESFFEFLRVASIRIAKNKASKEKKVHLTWERMRLLVSLRLRMSTLV